MWKRPQTLEEILCEGTIEVVAETADGTADLTNLATFCWVHHHVVIHGRGMIPDPDSPPGRIRFNPP